MKAVDIDINFPASAAMMSPGSDAAILNGCKCPVWDNGRGKGYFGQPGVFVQSADCPIHGFNSDDKPQTTAA